MLDLSLANYLFSQSFPKYNLKFDPQHNSWCKHQPIDLDASEGANRNPSNRKKALEGLCVGLFVRYPWNQG